MVRIVRKVMQHVTSISGCFSDFHLAGFRYITARMCTLCIPMRRFQMVPRGPRISRPEWAGSRLCPALKSWLINPRGKNAHSYRGKNSPAIRFSQRNQLNSTLTARLEVMSRWYTIGSFNRNSIKRPSLKQDSMM